MKNVRSRLVSAEASRFLQLRAVKRADQRIRLSKEYSTGKDYAIQ